MKCLASSIPALLLLVLSSCNERTPLFRFISPQQSNLHFNNRITENDSINPIDVTNIYNGAGVGIGDFNNDGLPDIYFAGNQVPCQLYLNCGKMKFEDVTEVAAVDGSGMWCRGVSVVDINSDGLLDLYVCTTIFPDSTKRKNLLYVNLGPNEKGIPRFKEMAADYGLADDSYSTMAAFFDYDNDGDLDVYITVNEILEDENPSIYRPKIIDGSFPSTGRLYRNEGSIRDGHPFYRNVSMEAKVTIEGYGHAATIADFNRDGWKDIFVTNDFLSNDILYINNHDGTFTDKAASYFKHTSANGMGQDVIDINNDGLSDLVELDMDPEDNFRKKILMSGYNYQNYQNNDLYGYQYQYVRNTLQLNQGPRIVNGDSLGDPIFSDIGFFAGISSTDWSWAPLVQDFDNDGLRDIIITNGFPKDLTDHDFIAFREKSFITASKREVIDKMPIVKIDNYAFRNNGDLSFSNFTKEWGLAQPSFSNGAAYADFDGDGDMDIVMSNINDEAFIYENTGEKENHFISVKLKGDSININGLGAWIELHYEGKLQAYEQTPYRGYLSTVTLQPHFGLGAVTSIDSLVVKWPDGRKQTMLKPAVDREIIADHRNAIVPYNWEMPGTNPASLFTDITASAGAGFYHEASDFIDFNIQRLLPHKLSEYDPGLAVGDLNNDGTDDIVCGGSKSGYTSLLLQQPDGKFAPKHLLTGRTVLQSEDMGICLFDADLDGDPDLYIASGGNEAEADSPSYQDRLYINDGQANFCLRDNAIPKNLTSKSCVRASDFDKDGDLDLFIAGRLLPWKYPQPVSSFIYRNDSRGDKIKFTDVSDQVAPFLKDIGMVCDAVWTDFDNDGWQDLLLAGEWMPIKILKNEKGYLRDISSSLDQQLGWWNSISCGDFDNDGDMDYVAGNMGTNSFYKASDEYPVSIYALDFYKQNSVQCIVTSFLKDHENGILREFTTHNRDDVVEQFPSLKKRFLTYKDFGKAGFNDLFTADEMKNAGKLTANYLKSAFLRNDGKGNFTIEALPDVAQFSYLNGMVADDFDGDGNLDLCISANDFSTEPSNGRYDALNGLVLKGNGKGRFAPLSIAESGIFIAGNGKSLVKFRGADGSYRIAASQHRGPLRLYQLRLPAMNIPLKPSDVAATVIYKDGRREKRNVDCGSSFLSQSGRFVAAGKKVASVEITDAKGNKRVVTPGR